MANIVEVPCPNDVEVWDVGPNYMDRFTVFMPDGAVFTMSTNALSPIGICNYEGSSKTVRKDGRRRHTIPEHVSKKIEALRT